MFYFFEKMYEAMVQVCVVHKALFRSIGNAFMDLCVLMLIGLNVN